MKKIVEYINSFGSQLLFPDNLFLIYDYLTNRPSMRQRLFENQLDPQQMIYSLDDQESAPVVSSFNELDKDRLFPITVREKIALHGSWTLGLRKINGVQRVMGNHGHDLLMYKTDFNGLESFIAIARASIPPVEWPDLLTEEGLKRESILHALDYSIYTLQELGSNKDIGSVCIMIDFCQRKFYAVTEVDFPRTVDLLNPTPEVGFDIVAF